MARSGKATTATAAAAEHSKDLNSAAVTEGGKKRRRPTKKPSAAGDAATPKVRGVTVDESISFLRAFLGFKQSTGSAPTMSTMEEFIRLFESSLPPEITSKKISNKIRCIRRKFGKGKPSSDPKDLLARQLLFEAWPPPGSSAARVTKKEEEKEEEEEEVENEEDEEDCGDFANELDGVDMGERFPNFKIAMEICLKKIGIVRSPPTLVDFVRVFGLKELATMESKLKEQHCLEMSALSMKFNVKEQILSKLFAGMGSDF